MPVRYFEDEALPGTDGADQPTEEMSERQNYGKKLRVVAGENGAFSLAASVRFDSTFRVQAAPYSRELARSPADQSPLLRSHRGLCFREADLDGADLLYTNIKRARFDGATIGPTSTIPVVYAGARREW